MKTIHKQIWENDVLYEKSDVQRIFIHINFCCLSTACRSLSNVYFKTKQFCESTQLRKIKFHGIKGLKNKTGKKTKQVCHGKRFKVSPKPSCCAALTGLLRHLNGSTMAWGSRCIGAMRANSAVGCPYMVKPKRSTTEDQTGVQRRMEKYRRNVSPKILKWEKSNKY